MASRWLDYGGHDAWFTPWHFGAAVHALCKAHGGYQSHRIEHRDPFHTVRMVYDDPCCLNVND